MNNELSIHPADLLALVAAPIAAQLTVATLTEATSASVIMGLADKEYDGDARKAVAETALIIARLILRGRGA